LCRLARQVMRGSRSWTGQPHINRRTYAPRNDEVTPAITRNACRNSTNKLGDDRSSTHQAPPNERTHHQQVGNEDELQKTVLFIIAPTLSTTLENQGVEAISPFHRLIDGQGAEASLIALY
jgi:hypothetical protein